MTEFKVNVWPSREIIYTHLPDVPNNPSDCRLGGACSTDSSNSFNGLAKCAHSFLMLDTLETGARGLFFI